MSLSLHRCAFAVLACASALTSVVAQPVPPTTSPTSPMPSRAVPGPVPGGAIPAGPDTGTPGASGSLPLGTPSAPAVLAPSGGTAAARAAAARPPTTNQNPVSRSRDATPPRPGAIDATGRPVGGAAAAGLPLDSRGTRAARGPAAVGAGGFPSGLRDCAGTIDRAERARCAAALYGPGR